jgi:lipopolysaccharide/colanic/teichoic acid biosynthesis glycosyltransferase
MIVISTSVWLKNGRPILFIQTRPGFMGKPFKLYKFRTMSEEKDESGKPLPDSLRLTTLGRFLRSTSLDELPQLFNVLRGEMSLVGPRPLLMQYLDRYSSEQFHRHYALPGITGWAQINGRNAVTWQDKFRLDVWYVDHCSLALDIKIIALTIWKILKREGIDQEGYISAEEFLGNSDRETMQE